MTLIWIAGALSAFTIALHFTSIAVAIGRCRQPAQPKRAAVHAPAVTLVRPVCGIENYIAETLASGFTLDYPRYEILFCVDDASDPVVPLVRQLIDAHPHIDARLLIGRDAICNNPKLNNVIKGWEAARHDWIVIADSNVLMPRDYIQRLLAAWRPDTGLVCSPPVGGRAENFWAELECAFLNTYQARWQYSADTFGFGFAQGKTMLWHRSVLENAGGIRALAAELAEDAASTKAVRGLGLRVRLVDAPFEQPLGTRSAHDVWRRQVRWAQLRRDSFKYYFATEILTGSVAPLLLASAVAVALEWPLAVIALLAAAWYAGEVLLAYAVGWHFTRQSLLAFVLRDLLLPVLWVNGWLGTAYNWRGNHVQTAEPRGRYSEYRVVRSFTRMTSALVKKTANRL